MGEFNTIFLLCYSQMQVVAGCYVHCNNLLSLFGQPSLLQNSSINSSKVIYCPAAWISVLRWLGNFSIEASASLLAEFEKYLIVQFLDSGFKVSIVAGLFLSIKHRSLGRQTKRQCSKLQHSAAAIEAAFCNIEQDLRDISAKNCAKTNCNICGNLATRNHKYFINIQL